MPAGGISGATHIHILDGVSAQGRASDPAIAVRPDGVNLVPAVLCDEKLAGDVGRIIRRGRHHPHHRAARLNGGADAALPVGRARRKPLDVDPVRDMLRGKVTAQPVHEQGVLPRIGDEHV